MTTQKTARRVFIYCALPCEAAPLIAHFKLKKDLSIWPFAVYCNHDICLTVSGLGKNAMAAAIAYSQARLAVIEPPAMINVGIAGHKDYDLGSPWLIDKITDADTQKRYYPPLVFTPPCSTAGIKTVSTPQPDYFPSELCDMEASAFYETAMRFTTGELVQCLKVISDNTLSPANHIQPKQVSAWIAEQLIVFESLLTTLSDLATTITVSDPPLFAELVQRIHFTANEQIQFKSLLCRWQVLNNQQVLVFDDSLQKARDVLQWLERAINSSEFCL